jgi:hypothetical protein
MVVTLNLSLEESWKIRSVAHTSQPVKHGNISKQEATLSYEILSASPGNKTNEILIGLPDRC